MKNIRVGDVVNYISMYGKSCQGKVVEIELIEPGESKGIETCECPADMVASSFFQLEYGWCFGDMIFDPVAKEIQDETAEALSQGRLPIF